MSQRQSTLGHIHLVRSDAHAGAQGPDTAAAVGSLLAGVGRREPAAIARLYDRFAPLVERVLARTIGADAELPDLINDTFVRIIEGAHRVRDPRTIAGWVTRIAVCTAVDCLRRRRQQRWLFFLPPEQIVEPVAPGLDDDAREGLRCTRQLLDGLPVADRVAFTLRLFGCMELEDVAAACGCSLATAKRRIARAERVFVPLARRHPVVRRWLESGTRWGEGA